MPVTASGPLSLPFAAAAKLIAESTTFQTLVGAADAAAALELIDYPYRDLAAGDYRIPGAYLFDDVSLDQFRRKRDRQEGGELGLVICGELSELYADDPKNDLLEWRNTLGAILTDLETLARTPSTAFGGTHWGLVRWKKIEVGWAEKCEEQLDDEEPQAARSFRFAMFVLEWT